MSHLPIIDAWPSLSEFARDIGTSYNTAKQTRRRGSIPPRYWQQVVARAKARGIKGVTLQRLAEGAEQLATGGPSDRR